MALTIVETLPKVSLSGNPVKVKIHTTNLFDNSVRRSLYTIILNVYDGNNNLLKEFSAEPDNYGDAWFNLEDAFLDLKPTITYPINEETPVVADSNACIEFYFMLAEGYGIPYVEQTESVTSDTFYVIFGGLPNWYLKRLDKQGTNFYEQIYLQNIWLTNQPEIKTVFDDQPEQLRFLHLSASQQTASLIAEITDENGTVTNTTIWTGTLEPYTIYQVLASWNFIAPENTISYTLYFKVGNNKITNDITFILDDVKPANTRYVVFRNSLGGFDCASLTGKMLTEIETKTTDFVTPEISKIREALVPEQSRAEGVKFLTGTIGWKNDAELEWLSELLLSEEKYLIIDYELVNIIIAQDKRQFKNDTFAPKTFNIEAVIGANDFFFSKLKHVIIPKLNLQTGGRLRLMNGGNLKITILR